MKKNREEIDRLEQEIQEESNNISKENMHRYYFRVGAIVGIIFVAISSFFENGFYEFFGTFGMGLLNGAAGLCILMAIISSLPGVKSDDKFKLDILKEKRKTLEKLKK